MLILGMVKKNIIVHCAVQENIHTSPTEGIEISQGMGGSGRSKNIKRCMKLSWNFQRGGEVLEKKSLPWGRYGYFLELHIVSAQKNKNKITSKLESISFHWQCMVPVFRITCNCKVLDDTVVAIEQCKIISSIKSLIAGSPETEVYM